MVRVLFLFYRPKDDTKDHGYILMQQQKNVRAAMHAESRNTRRIYNLIMQVYLSA